MEITREEQIRDDALAEGMDCEYMRICSDINELISTRNQDSSYGRGQVFILRQLKEKIRWGTSVQPETK